MVYFWMLLIFLFGSALGSFILVVADRYNTGLPFFKGRSICFSCNTELKKRDLFPFFSFLFLKGRCRYCGSKIPLETFFVEISMGILSVLAAFKSGFFVFESYSIMLNAYSIINFLIFTAIFAIILLISVYDLRHFIIPDSFLISLFILSFIYLIFFSFFHSSLILNTYHLLLQGLFSGIVLTLPFFLLFLFSRGTWFGLGDVKYIFVIGFSLGFVSGLSSVVLSFWVGALFALLAFLLKKTDRFLNLPPFINNLTIKSEIPFGPFLSFGFLVSFFVDLDFFQIKYLLNAIF